MGVRMLSTEQLKYLMTCNAKTATVIKHFLISGRLICPTTSYIWRRKKRKKKKNTQQQKNKLSSKGNPFSNLQIWRFMGFIILVLFEDVVTKHTKEAGGHLALHASCSLSSSRISSHQSYPTLCRVNKKLIYLFIYFKLKKEASFYEVLSTPSLLQTHRKFFMHLHLCPTS